MRSRAIYEAFRWGESTLCPAGDLLLWAVPLMLNARLTGGLVAAIEEHCVWTEDGGEAALDLTRAGQSLRRIAEQENLTNAALLRQRRLEYQREQKRAEAIHDLKATEPRGILESYLREEPVLISAIRRGDRPAARGVINRVLVVLYACANGRLDLLKSFVMELVVIMCRAAVQSGGGAQELLGSNYARLAELAEIDGEESLSHWLVQMLEQIMDSLENQRPSTAVLPPVLMEYLQEHHGADVSRDDAAAALHMSPSHFSRMVKEETGRSFTDLLNQVRVDHACTLLRTTDRTLVDVAFEVGFSDQSYFTKVFRRYMGHTPRHYRQMAQS
jgi:AraC-like DNA-binding protein/transposase-like protein